MYKYLKLKIEKKAVNKEIELFKMQFNNIKNTNVENKNENEKIGQENIKKIKEEIKKLEENIEKKFENAKQVAVLESKNKALEEQISAQTEQLKAAASGYDLKEQQEFDNYANKTRQENIRKILNDANIGDKMKRNSDNKNENEILKEEYYLPFIFEDYNINNKWICLEKYTACKYKSNLNMGNKGNIALEKNELIYDKDLVYNNFNEVLFENLERSKEFKKINLENIASEKLKIKIPSQNDKKNEKQNEEEEENFKVEKVVVDSYKDYNIYIRKGKNEILLGNYFCETAVEILKNFPNADLYLLFIENICYFYLKEKKKKKFMENIAPLSRDVLLLPELKLMENIYLCILMILLQEVLLLNVITLNILPKKICNLFFPLCSLIGGLKLKIFHGLSLTEILFLKKFYLTQNY